MSKRRISVKPKSQSISYFEVSPSKRRAVHKKSLSAVPESSSVNSSSSTRFLSSDKNEAEEVDVHGASRPTDVISGDSPDVLISSEWHDHDPESSGQDDTTFPDTVSSSAYEKRQQKAADNWAEVRVQLLRASVETGIPSPCSVCAECEEPAVAICRDCGPQAYYCANHVDSVHSLTNIFHRPFLWKNGMLHPYYFKQSRTFPALHCCCTTYIKEVVCLDPKGFQHCVCVTFCKCEPEAVTLVRHNMWPATPATPTLAFHQDLLLWMESLLLEGCIGVDAFCRSLEYKIGRDISKQLRKIYPVMIDAFEEYRFNRYQLDCLLFLSPDLNTTAICPACPQSNGTQIISMDGVFGLCRKKSAGVSVRPPLFSGVFFEEQQAVDEFVADYDTFGQIIDKGCHEFLAGDTLRSKSRYAALDETAVFGSICRHEFPQRFLNMKHGERLAYPVYLLKKAHQNKGDKCLLLLYDIACLLETHLKNRGHLDMLEKTTLGVPIFHVYGHCAFCQLTYSPRVLTGCGLTDGEAMERLWSCLRRFAKSTKEMRPSHRIDVLTSALLHYASRVRLNLGASLVKRLKNAQNTQHSATEDLSKLINESNGTLTESSAEQLQKQQHGLFARSQTDLNGQSIAARLAKKISSSTSTLKRTVSRFNGMRHDQFEGVAYHLPANLNWETVSNLEELSTLEVASAGNCTIPIHLWIKVVRACNMKERATEEVKMIMEEINTVANNLKYEHSVISRHIQDIATSDSLSLFQKGCLNLLHRRLLLCESYLITFSRTVNQYHTVELPDTSLLGPDGSFFYNCQINS
ncbi:uncharacterized protein LOC135351424 [Halichondria panicea]|uniref:uncharacterized protein LOC135351424 n=1 Tax=Halichondria panicea TaxID=6063 RepID=UPI00312B748C